MGSIIFFINQLPRNHFLSNKPLSYQNLTQKLYFFIEFKNYTVYKYYMQEIDDYKYVVTNSSCLTGCTNAYSNYQTVTGSLIPMSNGNQNGQFIFYKTLFHFIFILIKILF